MIARHVAINLQFGQSKSPTKDDAAATPADLFQIIAICYQIMPSSLGSHSEISGT